MKTMKKLLTIVFAETMLFGMGINVFAADGDEVTITVKSDDSHTYNVYQIFTGDLVGNELSNVKWGKNGTGTEGDAVPEATVKTVSDLSGTDKSKAEAIKNYVNSTNPIISGLTKDTEEANRKVVPGYYFIEDVTANVPDGEEKSLYIVRIAKDITIEPKRNTTSSDKKLDDKNDSDTTATADNETMKTSSDYDIGDEVPYHVTATISSKAGNYNKYHITLEDILESGKFDTITLDKTSIKLGDATIAETDAYTVTTIWNTEPTNTGFKVTFEFVPKERNTLDSIAGKTISINFTAKLGANANIGSEGNKNTLKVSYSNNPNETDGHSEGKTPDKVVITFTYKVVVDKYDEDNTTPLENAEFTLYKVSKAVAEAGVTGADAKAKNEAWKNAAHIAVLTTTASEGKTSGKNNRFVFKGIDDGYYVLCETTTPSGYNTMDPKVFKVEATHGGDDGLTLSSLNGTKVNGEITFVSDITTGTLSTSVVNKKGSTLPSTGGAGTTAFYVIGGVLVAGAAVMLIAKNRFSNTK